MAGGGLGALVISAAGNFSVSGTLWLFGWPFLLQLLAGTTLHLLAVGGGARLGIPALIPGVDSSSASSPRTTTARPSTSPHCARRSTPSNASRW